MKIGTRAGARIYPAPSSGQTTWTYREIFGEADIPSIVSTISTVRHPLALVVETHRGKRRAPEKGLAKALNEAARDYFKYAGDERAGTPSDFVKWSEHVSEAGATLLRALGVDPAKPMPTPLPRAVFEALCSRPDKSLTAANYGVENHATALEEVAHGAAFIHDLGKQAARYHASRTVPVKDRARRRDLSPRQEFLLLLARAYETSFGESVPKFVNSGASPFVRFALWVCTTLAERMVKLADQAPGPSSARNNIRGNAIDKALPADCIAAAKLGHTTGTQVTDDMRSRVYALLRAPRPTYSPVAR